LIGLLKDNLVLIGTVAFFVLKCVHGYRRGCIRMLTSLAGMAVSLFAARYFMPKLVTRMEQNASWMNWVQSEVIPKLNGITPSMVFSVLSFLVLFVIIYVLIRILASTLDRLVEGSVLGILNEVLGMIVGAAEAVVFLWIFMLAVEVLPHFPICEEILRQINSDGLLSLLHDNNLLVSFLARMSIFTKSV